MVVVWQVVVLLASVTLKVYVLAAEAESTLLAIAVQGAPPVVEYS